MGNIIHDSRIETARALDRGESKPAVRSDVSVRAVTSYLAHLLKFLQDRNYRPDK
jgi:hypothetical protein